MHPDLSRLVGLSLLLRQEFGRIDRLLFGTSPLNDENPDEPFDYLGRFRRAGSCSCC